MLWRNGKSGVRFAIWECVPLRRGGARNAERAEILRRRYSPGGSIGSSASLLSRFERRLDLARDIDQESYAWSAAAFTPCDTLLPAAS